MVRNVLVYALVLGTVWGAVAALTQASPRQDIASQVSTVSLGQLILRDTFSDNKTADMWKVWADDVNLCWVSETNGRLEVQAKQDPGDKFSGYVANAWRLNPKDDFSLRVDFHCSMQTHGRASVSLGITPNGRAPRSRRVDLLALCTNYGQIFSYEWAEDGADTDSASWQRPDADGSMFISYDAAEDTLYVSFLGYGPGNACQAYPGLLQGQWQGEPVFVFLGGGSDNANIPSGAAYLDSLTVETGTVVEASLQKVYHFKSVTDNRHFYTMSEGEKEKILKNYAATWAYDGPVFYAFPDNSDPDCKPVHRFWSTTLGVHFYTMSEGEKNKFMDVNSGWTYEGEAFYAYPAGQQPAWALPVYRFWCQSNAAHLYTIDETEKAKLLKSPDVWTYEGIAWYAMK